MKQPFSLQVNAPQVSQRAKRSTNVISCFVVENESYIEVRDCSIKSANDKEIFDKALDHYITQIIAHQKRSKTSLGISPTDLVDNTARVTDDAIARINESIKKDFVERMRLRDNEINDYCFSLNFPSLV